MGRKKMEKTIPDETLQAIFDVWYAQKGYPLKMNWADFTRTVADAGYDISRTSLMRREHLREYIEKQFSAVQEGTLCGSGYQTLDINAIMNGSDQKVRDALRTLDDQNKCMARTIELLNGKAASLNSKIAELEEENMRLSEKLEKKSKRVEELGEAERNLRVLKQKLKQQNTEDVERFYNEIEETGVIPNDCILVDESTSPSELEDGVRRNRLSLVIDCLREEASDGKEN